MTVKKQKNAPPPAAPLTPTQRRLFLLGKIDLNGKSITKAPASAKPAPPCRNTVDFKLLLWRKALKKKS